MYKCKNCNSTAIEQITSGQRVSDVVGVTSDGGLTCSLKTFIPLEDDYATFYRCRNCLAILPHATTEALVITLQGGNDGKVQV